MTALGLPSYSAAALLYTFLLILLCTSWRGRLQGGLLLSAVAVSVIWSGLAGVVGDSEYISLKAFMAVETARNTIWSAFLWYLLSFTRVNRQSCWLSFPVLGYLLLAIFTVAMELDFITGAIAYAAGVDLRILSHVAQAIVGLILVEQLFRNTRLELRWAIKFLCFGLGSLFAYDFVLYSEALLVNNIEPYLWDARAIVNLIAVPLIAVSAARNPHWSVDIFISRSVVFHTTALVGTGVYLLVMASVGYYIRDFGGTWGRVGQIGFIVGALLVLVLVIFSGTIRSWFKVFFNQHFFTYKYDYRKEWLGLNRKLAGESSAELLRERCVQVLCDMTESSYGVLWERSESGRYVITAEHNLNPEVLTEIAPEDSLIQFLQKRQWVVEAPEYLETPELYEGLNLDHWLQDVESFWLAVPLMRGGELHGFIVLTQPRTQRDINWEDHDLLKTVGQQFANYLALLETSEELADARQFEAYNRLSAFLVHDLKNLVAQISMVVANAEKHKRNPEFIDDAIDTLANAVTKMNHMLAQLRQGNVTQQLQRKIELHEALQQVVEQQRQMEPQPELVRVDESLSIQADMDKLVAVLGHLVRNAQDATDKNGSVQLALYKQDNQAIIDIKDTGSGMDARFIRDRLFRPFDTTKGNAGMGIGVFEARQFVQSHGGRVEVESEPGQGTRFRLCFSLPALDTDLEKESL